MARTYFPIAFLSRPPRRMCVARRTVEIPGAAMGSSTLAEERIVIPGRAPNLASPATRLGAESCITQRIVVRLNARAHVEMVLYVESGRSVIADQLTAIVFPMRAGVIVPGLHAETASLILEKFAMMVVTKTVHAIDGAMDLTRLRQRRAVTERWTRRRSATTRGGTRIRWRMPVGQIVHSLVAGMAWSTRARSAMIRQETPTAFPMLADWIATHTVAAIGSWIVMRNATMEMA